MVYKVPVSPLGNCTIYAVKVTLVDAAPEVEMGLLDDNLECNVLSPAINGMIG